MRLMATAIAATALAVVQDAYAAGSPEDGARAFFAVYATFHPSDGIPNASARAQYAPAVSPALEQLFAQAERAEAEFTSAHKDSPPLMEGDLMTSNFEGATSFEIGSCTRGVRIATCKINLVYDPGGREKPIRWTDSLMLVASDRGWKVDDVVYGATWAFGNKGRLTETLRRVIADAGS